MCKDAYIKQAYDFNFLWLQRKLGLREEEWVTER